MWKSVVDFFDDEWIPALILLTGVSMVCLVGYVKIKQMNIPYDVVTASGAEYNHVYVLSQDKYGTEFQSKDGDKIMVRESYVMKRVK